VAKAKISVVLSIGAPSSLAVELADWMNICIVGFLKKNQHNIYTHPFRVLETPLSKK
jgi:FdhD protein